MKLNAYHSYSVIFSLESEFICWVFFWGGGWEGGKLVLILTAVGRKLLSNSSHAFLFCASHDDY